MRQAVAPLLLVLFALALAGCGPAGGAWLIALLAIAMAIAGCSESHTTRPDGSTEDGAVDVPDGGSWERCCQSGVVSTCYCPPMTACNYGRGLVVCDDGTCGVGTGSPEDVARICGGELDAGVDAGGDWEPCCDDASGTISTCFCPADAECNYGWFRTCEDGSCRTGGACPEDDAGVDVFVDAG